MIACSFTNNIVEFMTNGLKGILPPEIIIFIVSLFPVLELRGGIIAAKLLGVTLIKANVICVIGNLLPIPLILLFFNHIFEWMKNTKLVKLASKIEAKAIKGSKSILKYKKWGLLIFVAIPLPGTGAWTGALIASLFKFNFKDSLFAIFGGVISATIIMSFFCYGIPYIISLF